MSDFGDRNLYIARRSGKFSNVMTDLAIAKRDFRKSIQLAYLDIVNKYKRSVLGPLWITASTIAFIGGFALLGSIIFGAQRLSYLTYLAAGIVFWQHVVVLMSESASAFPNESASITSEQTSLLSILIRTMARNFIGLLHNLPILLAVVVFRQDIGWSILWAIPTFLLVSFFLFNVSVVLSILATRYRDIVPAVSMFLQFMFYFTPIFWPADTVKDYPERLMLELNPFFHVITLLRDPFLGRTPELMSWLAVGGLSVGSFMIAMFLFIRFQHRVVYWV